MAILLRIQGKDLTWPRKPYLTSTTPITILTSILTTLLNLFALTTLASSLLLKCTVQFSRSVVSDSLGPHGLQQVRPPCPSPVPRVYSNSRPLSQRCHPTISSSAIPFSSLLQSFPASGSFQMSQFFPSGGQSMGVSASTSVVSMTTQD